MENGGNGFTNGLRGQNSSNGNQSWDFWELGTSRFDWSTSFNEESTATAATAEAAAQALVFFHQGEEDNGHQQYQTLYSGGSHAHPDPHLTSLKLGKRHYFEDGGAPLGERHVPGFPIGKRVRSYGVGGGASSSSTYSSASAVAGMVSAVAVPKCQVEGCHVPLVNVKDYHRRHKVCEMHSKAPRVVVLGIEQRFCQQCSRFHVVSEFDDSKRSCRRRLAGHNERRRKNSNDSITRNPSQESKSIGRRFSCIASSSRRALSLLSARSASSVSPSDASDLSSQSSAALRELIAENRAAVLTRQLFSDRAWHCHSMDELGGAQPALISHIPHHQLFPEPPEWGRFHESGTHVTLDLMQAPSSPFGFMSGRHKSKEEEEECCEIWKSLEGTPVV